MSIEQEVPVTEPTARETLTRLVEAANCGDKGSVESLRLWLDEHPETWREAGDLAAHVEKTWVRLAAAGNVLVEESIHREVDRIRGELQSSTPTTLERLLVDQIVACWLNLKQAEICAASSRQSSLSQGRYHDQRVERAQRRYFAAIKMLAQVRGLPLSALMPRQASASQPGPEASGVAQEASGQGGSSQITPLPAQAAAHGLHILPESRDLSGQGLTATG